MPKNFFPTMLLTACLLFPVRALAKDAPPSQDPSAKEETKEVSKEPPKESAMEFEKNLTFDFELLEDPKKTIRNPFTSQLPKKEVVVDVKPPTSVQNLQSQMIAPPPENRDIKISQVQTPILNVNGIIWNSNNPQAIIDDKIYKIGDTVGSSVIKNISKTGVILTYQGIEFTAKVP